MLEFLSDLFRYAKERRKYWLLPLVLMLVILGALVLFAQQSTIAPFVYTLF